ncbi:Fatty acid synthase subunit beta [Exophiala dermatitidis]
MPSSINAGGRWWHHQRGSLTGPTFVTSCTESGAASPPTRSNLNDSELNPSREEFTMALVDEHLPLFQQDFGKRGRLDDVIKHTALIVETEIDESIIDSGSDTPNIGQLSAESRSHSSSPSTSYSKPSVQLLKYGPTCLQLRVEEHLAQHACALWEESMRTHQEQLPDGWPVLSPNASTDELMTRFLDYVGRLVEGRASQNKAGATFSILGSVFDAFLCAIGEDDIHSFVLHHSELLEGCFNATVLSFYRASELLGRPTSSPTPSLLRASRTNVARVYAVFGGQGTSGPLLELQQLYSVYRPLLDNFLSRVSNYLSVLTSGHQFCNNYPNGLDIIRWIRDADSHPDLEYTRSPPVSCPLIGLLQLANYSIAAYILGFTEMKTIFRGLAGHSQGVITAAVVSQASSWNSFEELALDAMKIFVSIGCRSQESRPQAYLPPEVRKYAEEHGEGTPSFLLGVRGTNLAAIESMVAEANASLPVGERVEIALVNGPRHFVIGGPPSSLQGLVRSIRSTTPADSDESRIPFSQRHRRVKLGYLPVSAPFHTTYLQSAAMRCTSLDLDDLEWKPGSLTIPVYDTSTGEDLRHSSATNLIPRLVELVMAERLDWPASTPFLDATHVIDFGPGKSTEGAGALLERLTVGRGVRTIIFESLNAQDMSDLGGRVELFTCCELPKGRNWKEEYSPRLIRDESGRKLVQTKLSTLLKAPPIMVAGMTPTTCSPDLVLATISAGYHIELACGGFHKPEMMENTIRNIVARLPVGKGITCNVIYAAPRSLKWQINLIRELRGKLLPIHGLTIGAGVPSLEVANTYINELGLSHISFKPGSVSAINQVLEIARSQPNFPVILQWTGGRAGGHHSFEDFHHPMLECYAKIRRCPNVILVAGSGFGDAQSSYPYLSGQWSLKYGAAPMPFDGILLGSRVMVAKEARTSAEAKALITDIPGVSDRDWEGTYAGCAGGVMTVTSEMGEPIHKIATRGVHLWAELDKTIFSIPDKKKRLQALLRKRHYVISRLNADFQKVWFARTDGNDAAELADMTYTQVVSRLLELTYLASSQRWIDPSYKTLMQDWLTHLDRCFASSPVSSPLSRECEQHETLIDLKRTVSTVYPQADEQLLSFPDQATFTSFCRRSGIKPVPFIIALDEHFEYYFKKDSLWQSEDVEAVIDRDVGRTCILQGPVAARYSSRTDQGIKELLDEIHEEWSSLLAGAVQSISHSLDEVTDPAITFPNPSLLEDKIELLSSDDDGFLSEGGDDLWYTRLAGHASWARIALQTLNVVRERQLCHNPIRSVFRPTPGVIAEIHSGSIERISLYRGSSVNLHEKLAELQLVDRQLIAMRLEAPITADGHNAALVQQFRISKDLLTPLQDITSRPVEQVQEFYRRIWFGSGEAHKTATTSLRDARFEEKYYLTEEHVRAFVKATADQNISSGVGRVPLDFAVVVAWKALMKPLFSVDADLLNLVHLGNEFRLEDGAKGLREGDVLVTNSRVTRFVQQDAGALVEVHAEIRREAVPIIRIISQFLYRGYKVAPQHSFDETENPATRVSLPGSKDLAVLSSRPWFHLIEPSATLLRADLMVRSSSLRTFSDDGKTCLTTTKGSVSRKGQHGVWKHCADIMWTSPSPECIVQSYLARYGQPTTERKYFEAPLIISSEGITCFAPADNADYARASGDLNPIHLSPAIASYVLLPGTITHGMNTSARVRAAIENRICGNDKDQFRSFRVKFVNMVLPGDELHVTIRHVGMVRGRRIFEFHARNLRTSLIAVEGEAEIENPRTAILFTGQGSQQVGMGLELRDKSDVARRLWDRADVHFLETYGFRISDIVKHNPTRLEVHFGGAKGRRIRDNYRSLKYNNPGMGEAPVFGSINETTPSHIFHAEGGLLHATQFTQPALTLMELSAYEDLEAKGILPLHTTFCGHSLGEYAAIFSIGKLLTLENLMSVVFYRGLVMQLAVERDQLGRSPYGMCAVNPSRLSIPLTEADLMNVVRVIGAETGRLLEIVNYNVKGSQYVCAGENLALSCLRTILDTLHAQKGRGTTGVSDDRAITMMVRDVVQTMGADSCSEVQTRGAATIPLSGIDVPFHSSFLKPGVDAFREYLYSKLRAEDMVPERMVGRYVPNLTARPFSLDSEYIASVLRLTKSPVLEKLLKEEDRLRG